MKQILLVAVLSGLSAVSALLLSARSPITAVTLIGYVVVLALLSVAALEYRIDWKRFFGRR